MIGNFHVEAPVNWQPQLNEEHDRHEWADLPVARELMQWLETQEAIDLLVEQLRART